MTKGRSPSRSASTRATRSGSHVGRYQCRRDCGPKSLRESCGGSRTDGSAGHPTFPAFSISSRYIRRKQAKSILTEVHRAARRIYKSDIDRALERRHLSVISYLPETDVLTCTGHEVVGNQRVARSAPQALAAAMSAASAESGCICSHRRPSVLSTSAFTTHDGV